MTAVDLFNLIAPINVRNDYMNFEIFCQSLCNLIAIDANGVLVGGEYTVKRLGENCDGRFGH